MAPQAEMGEMDPREKRENQVQDRLVCLGSFYPQEETVPYKKSSTEP